jgi:hypothetical protein
MLDSWQILEGYTFQQFEAVMERSGRLVEAGRVFPTPSFFPDQETEVRYLESDVVPAKSSETIATTMSPAGRYAIACLKAFEGAHQSLRGLQPFELGGPIVVR